MLSFEDANQKERKYQCFVCGKTYNSLVEMNEHVLASHEEGREYLKCPTCNYCVRDLKTHFKVKHPARIMPSGLQTRVAVWKDFKPSGSKKTRKPHFRTGTFTSHKSHCDFRYRSGMENEFFECLESDSDVETFYGEPFKVPYFYAGEWHDYIPDLRINFADGSVEIWEIKPSNQTHYEQNRAKWAAMTDYAHNMGWEFIVQTEVGLGKLRKKLRRQGKT